MKMRQQASCKRDDASSGDQGDTASDHSLAPSLPHSLTVAILDSATVPHGSAFWAWGMAEQLARHGHRVTLFCPPRSPLREPPPASGVILRTVPLRSNYDLL